MTSAAEDPAEPDIEWALSDPLSSFPLTPERPGRGEAAAQSGSVGRPTARDLVGDAAWLQAMVQAECAFTLALVAEHLAPEWLRDVVAQLVLPGRHHPSQVAGQARAGGNPAIPLAKLLAQEAEELHEGAGDYLHVGVTSQDIVDTAMMMIAARAAHRLDEVLGRAADAAAVLAERHAATPMAARTLGQQAVPTSFGLVAAGWLERIDAARADLAAQAGRLPLQWGGAVGTRAALTAWIARHAITETTVQDVQDRAAASLGLVNPPLPWHTDRLPLAACADAFARAAEAVGSVAAQAAVLSRTEIGEVTERLGEGEGGSSAMPHKRNPVTATLIVAAAMRIPALIAGVHSGMLVTDQRPMGAWHAQWPPFRQILVVALESGAACADLLGRLRVDTRRMAENLKRTDGLVYSVRASAALAPFLGEKRAFALVGSAARVAADEARPLAATLDRMLPYELPEKAHVAVAAAFDADAAVEVAAEAAHAAATRHRRLRARERAAGVPAAPGRHKPHRTEDAE